MRRKNESSNLIEKEIMKTVLPCLLVLICTTAALPAQAPKTIPRAVKGADSPKPQPPAEEIPAAGVTFSSLDAPDPRQDREAFAPGQLRFDDVDLAPVLDVYQELSHRTIIRASTLPPVKITLRNQTPLTRRETLQALDTVLAQNGITMIPLGTKWMKAVPAAQAATESPPVIELPLDLLPNSSSYMMYVVELKNRKPSEIVPVLQPLQKMPNAILACDREGILILRDYSSNIRQMLLVLERIDVPEKPNRKGNPLL
jgi:type II secretory pathway component GspD/PulD (secretin)